MKSYVSENIVVFIVVAIICLCIGIVSPILTILAINTLFGTGIPITIWTWLSMIWLSLIVGAWARSASQSNTTITKAVG